MAMDARLHQPTLVETWMEHARARPIMAAALVVAMGGTAAILGAWFFQYGMGLRPCPLCREQRYPYYFAIPLAIMTIMGDAVGSRRRVLLAALAVMAGLMLWTAAIGVYHAGIEWHWWLGPQECSGAPDLGTGLNLRKQLESINVTRCDEAAWRFLGVSLAGYNALIGLTLAAVAAWGFHTARKLPPQRD